MTEVIPEESSRPRRGRRRGDHSPRGRGPGRAREQLIDRLAGRAQAGGLQLAGEGGLLAQLTKRLLESALEGELTDHLGYDKHEVAGRDGGNSRNGHGAKTVLANVGPVEIECRATAPTNSSRNRGQTAETAVRGGRASRSSPPWFRA